MKNEQSVQYPPSVQLLIPKGKNDIEIDLHILFWPFVQCSPKSQLSGFYVDVTRHQGRHDRLESLIKGMDFSPNFVPLRVGSSKICASEGRGFGMPS